MKLRKWLAIALAGALVMQVPVTVQAEETNASCDGYSERHIKSKPDVTISNGQITVKMNVEVSEEADKVVGSIHVCQNPLSEETTEDGKKHYPVSVDTDDGSVEMKNGDHTYTMENLEGGITYYLYARVCDGNCKKTEDGYHYMMYLGSGSSSSNSGSSTSGNSNSKSAWASYEKTVNNQIEAAPSGSTIVMEKGISALSNSMMKELLKKGDVSLKLEFTYNDEEYIIIIPAGAALDNDIPWYGPLYLAERFGNSAGGAAAPIADVAAVAESTYEVKSGDTMGRIAAANNMTLAELLAKNPQIKNPNKIAVGQKINL